MADFPARLRELRKKHGISQRELANAIGMSTVGIQNYELQTRKPSAETIVLIADYFDVSLDYLMGRSDDQKRY